MFTEFQKNICNLRMILTALSHLNRKVKEIERRLLDLVKQDQQKQLTPLKSIPGRSRISKVGIRS
jgi:hypothetical protein